MRLGLVKPQEIDIVKACLPLVRKIWLEAFPGMELTPAQDEEFRALETAVILTVLQRALPAVLAAREASDLEKPMPLHTWNEYRVAFGDGTYQDITFDLKPDGGIKVTLTQAVLWPGAVSLERSTGWVTLDADQAGLFRKWVHRNAEALGERGRATSPVNGETDNG